MLWQRDADEGYFKRRVGISGTLCLRLLGDPGFSHQAYGHKFGGGIRCAGTALWL